MDFDALIERIRGRRPPTTTTADERDLIFQRALVKADAPGALAGGAGRNGWSRTISLSAAAIVTIGVAATGIAIAAHHRATGESPGHTSTSTSAGPTTTTAGKPALVSLATSCARGPKDPPVVAYVVVYPNGDGTQEQLAAVDLPSGRTLWSKDLPGQGISTIAAGNGGLYALTSVSDPREGKEYLVSVDGRTGHATVLTTIGADETYAGGLAISPNGEWALVAQAGDGAVGLPGPNGQTMTEVDLRDPSRQFVIQLPQPGGPWAVAFASSHIAYVTSFAGLSEIDVASHSVLGTVDLPSNEDDDPFLPGSLAISPTRSVAVVASHGGDLIVPAATLSTVSLPSSQYTGPIGLSTNAAANSVAFDCAGENVFAATDLGVVRVNLQTRTSQPVGVYHSFAGSLQDVASLAATSAIWAVRSFVSKIGTTTSFVQLSSNSATSGPAVGSLDGSAETMILAPG